MNVLILILSVVLMCTKWVGILQFYSVSHSNAIWHGKDSESRSGHAIVVAYDVPLAAISTLCASIEMI